MAFTTSQSHYLLNLLPEADGSFTQGDACLILNIYPLTVPVSVSVGGSITPTGAVSTLLTAYRSLGGTITPTGALGTVLTAYRALGGTLTPTGALGTVITYTVSLNGELTLTGAISGHDPSWILIDDILRWMGEWSVYTNYSLNDVVIHKTSGAAEYHVFVSKTAHNVGNAPNSSATYWRRLYQEPML